jgi:hypothetical protein
MRVKISLHTFINTFLVMKAEHTVAHYDGRNFTSKIATAIVSPFAQRFRQAWST